MLIVGDGHDPVVRERRYIICGLFLMRCSTGRSAQQLPEPQPQRPALQSGDAWRLAQTPDPYKTEKHKSQKPLQEFICCVFYSTFSLVTGVNLPAIKLILQTWNASTWAWQPLTQTYILVFSPNILETWNGLWQGEHDLYFTVRLLFFPYSEREMFF